MLLSRKMRNLRFPIQLVLKRKPEVLRNTLCICIRPGVKKNEGKKEERVSVPFNFQTAARGLCTTLDSADPGTPESASVLEYETITEAVDQDDEHSHLRIQLYPDDSDVYLSRLYEASCIQQVFDVVEEIESKEEETLTIKHCSQALVSLWDLQKLMFKMGPFFDPTKDFEHRELFIQEIRRHETFKEKILENLIKNLEYLEDEPLAASLLCLKRMQYDVRSPESEKLVEECIRRKDSLSLPAVSRVCVSMRSEGLYGHYVTANFLPVLMKQCESMESDLELRLVSIAVRNSQRLLSLTMIELFREKIEMLLEKDIEFETVTLCKTLLALVDTKGIGEDPSFLLRKIGNRLSERVPKMILLDLLSLQRFIETGSQEPFPLIEALIVRISRLIEENHPLRLDLIACIAPFMKNVYHHQKIRGIISENIENYEDFETITPMLYKILRTTRFSDRSVYDSYWGKVLSLLTIETNTARKVIRFAVDYLNFVQGFGTTYRYSQFERKVKQLLYFYLDNYFSLTQPTFFSPSDFAKAFSFLVAFNYLQGEDLIFQKTDYIEKLDSLAPQIKVFDLTMIGRSVDVSLQATQLSKSSTPKYYDHLLQICSILEEQISSRLIHRPDDLNTLDLIACARTQNYIKTATRESPIFKKSIDLVLKRGLTDSRVAKDLCNCILGSGVYNEPQICTRLGEFIEKVGYDVSPEVAEKFPIVCFASGFEGEHFLHIFETCSKIIHKNLGRFSPLGILQSCLALCHYRSLTRELVNDIFSVEFIDEVDRGLKLIFGAGAAQMKVRRAFMELNRAVCIDMPDARVPWFHKKFCEEMISIAPNKVGYIHNEVYELLGDIFSDMDVVQKQVYSPYYYLLDYLIEFDENNCPIKRPKRKSGLFSFQKSSSSTVAHDKVVITILPAIAFTKNVRELKGMYKLQRRHLEILGYRLVTIDPQKWNSMYMSEPSVKTEFLESQIFKKENYSKYSELNENKRKE